KGVSSVSPNAPAHLFVTLGNAPAIVFEAFLLEGIRFSHVHVLTSEKPDIAPIEEFFCGGVGGSDVTVMVTRVSGFNELRSEQDHARFEEVMYRWFLETRTRPEQRYVCIAGGFKTMSAAMQKAAAVLGAREVFHVLADDGRQRPPETVSEVLEAHRRGRLHFIRLGPESGWPQFRDVNASKYPLTVVRQEGIERWVTAPDNAFRERLREIVERAHRVAESWEALHDLPFPDLATWPTADLRWLQEPLDPDRARDRTWVRGLPKIELHCHLGGFATHGDLLERVRDAAEDRARLPKREAPPLPENWPQPDEPIGLEAYMQLGDATGSTLLKDPGCLREHCRLMYDHFCEHNVIYAEVRCSPANYADPDRNRSAWDVLSDIRTVFQKCMEERREGNGGRPPCHVNLIIIATRRAHGDYRAAISRHLALAVTAAEHWREETECRVVGVDLAGYEDERTRPHYFRDEFTAVHRCGLAVTVHAGENDDAEAIWRAVFDLNARRIGHGLTLDQSRELLRSVADRGIGVELCPYANFQIRGYPLAGQSDDDRRGQYPLLRYLREDVRVTVNTDNIGISAASLTDNLLFAAKLCPGLTRLDLLRLQRNAVETAFASATARHGLLREYSRLIEEAWR
ncbi:MAG: hypothetical protein D6725_00295, partial [Planctomycetota bacterium]